MDLEAKIEKATNEFFDMNTVSVETPTQTTPEPAKTPLKDKDLYQQYRNAVYEESKKSRPNGARPITAQYVSSVINGSIKRKFKRAKEQVKHFEKIGDRERASMARQQYMYQVFLPALEALSNVVDIDELLNAPPIIDQLDEYAMVEGGSGKGYTATFLKTMYGNKRGNFTPMSDDVVRKTVDRIKWLIGDNQIRVAANKAYKMKKAVDLGKNSASDDDYEILAKVSVNAV